MENKRLYKGFSIKLLDRNFRLFLVLSSVFALGSFSYSFLLIYAKSFGFALYSIPILYLVFTAVASATALLFGHLADRIGRKPVMALSFILWCLVCALLLFVHNYAGIIASFVLYGLHRGAIEPVQKTLVSELAPAEYRASGLGGFQMVTGLCALPASLMAGALWDSLGTSVPLIVSLSLTIAALFMLAFVREKRPLTR